MADQLIPRREMQFQLYEVLNTAALCEKARFEEHNVETFNAVIDMAEKMAEELFLHNAVVDKNEPTFDGTKVSMIDDVKVAFDTYRESGLSRVTSILKMAACSFLLPWWMPARVIF